MDSSEKPLRKKGKKARKTLKVERTTATNDPPLEQENGQTNNNGGEYNPFEEANGAESIEERDGNDNFATDDKIGPFAAM